MNDHDKMGEPEYVVEAVETPAGTALAVYEVREQVGQAVKRVLGLYFAGMILMAGGLSLKALLGLLGKDKS